MMRTTQALILALDTSTRIISIALHDGQQVIAERSWMSNDYHTVELAPAVADLFAHGDLSISELTMVGVAIGPGSFTGLRIGLGLAKGLSLALHIPVIGVATLEILAQAQPVNEKQLAAILKAGRGRYAVEWFEAKENHWTAKQEVEVVTLQQLIQKIHIPTTICGEIEASDRALLIESTQLATLAPPAHSLRRAAYLAELAWQKWQQGRFEKTEFLVPTYLHYNESIPG